MEDRVLAHEAADGVMVDLLAEPGYGEGMRIYREMQKVWEREATSKEERCRNR